MTYVTDDQNLQPAKVAKMLTHRHDVQQRLGRMFMGSIARVNDEGINPLSQELGGARC